MQYQTHEFLLEKMDSIIIVEFYPISLDINYVLLLDYARIPTYKKFEFGRYISKDHKESFGKELEWDSDRGKYFFSILPYFFIDSSHLQNSIDGTCLMTWQGIGLETGI